MSGNGANKTKNLCFSLYSNNNNINNATLSQYGNNTMNINNNERNSIKNSNLNNDLNFESNNFNTNNF
jgi:hypothetical protein